MHLLYECTVNVTSTCRRTPNSTASPASASCAAPRIPMNSWRGRGAGLNTALAISDECSLAGSVRAHVAAKEAGLKLLIGSEFTLVDGTKLVLLAQNRAGYGNLSALITLGRKGGKGAYRLTRGDLESLIPGRAVPDCLCLWLAKRKTTPPPGAGWPSAFPAAAGSASASSTARTMHSASPASWHWRRPVDWRPWRRATCTCTRAGAAPCRTMLTALRLKTTVFAAGHALFPNGAAPPAHPPASRPPLPRALLDETLKITERCDFSLDELRYEYPEEIVPARRDGDGLSRPPGRGRARAPISGGVPLLGARAGRARTPADCRAAVRGPIS